MVNIQLYGAKYWYGAGTDLFKRIKKKKIFGE